MRIVFFGSDDFAAAHFEALIASPFKVLGCVAPPDRPKGRGMKVVDSPVKESAQKAGVPVWQPANLKDEAFVGALRALQADLFVVIAYGKFLPSEIFNMPAYGAINVHASLLPKYRGAAPINWVIIHGEEETGISVIRINEEMDAGDILAQLKIPIAPDETAITLRTKMIGLGPDLLLKTIADLPAGTGKPQNENFSTFAPKLIKELGNVRWTKRAQEICNLTRGLLPWPSAYTFYQGKMLKILEAQMIDRSFPYDEPGKVLEISKRGITVAAGRGTILIKRVHFQDSKPMDAYDFVIGHDITVGFKFSYDKNDGQEKER
ncbi:MAG TPA: methionyl-tRNA formyltransferase [Candidatus Omnitrophota bacterium]|nr:methionyl-tRNA formyltransferase [Candidatus Omnitrophota bacterium]